MATGHSRSISNGSPRHLLSPEAKHRNGVGLEYSVLAPYGMLSDKTQFPTVWACACTKGCRKVYEKKGSGWSAIMDHLANAHGIAKDATHPTAISKQQKQARDESKKRALDAGMTEGRFQAICTTRYIIRRLLPFSHVECPEFRATVHPAWKVIKAETQRNMVAEMYLCMVSAVKKAIPAVIVTSLLPAFWINADLWTGLLCAARGRPMLLFPSPSSVTIPKFCSCTA